MSTFDFSRRTFLRRAGGLAAAPVLASNGQSFAASLSDVLNPMSPKSPHYLPKVKSVIFLFMYGGPSHMDTFDYKPALYPLDGQTIEVKTRGRGGAKSQGRVVGPKWDFQRYGQCGKHVSDLFPNVGKHVDDMAFVHSMYAESPIHGSAMLMMNSGSLLSGRPSMGSWVTQALGSQNPNLPGYVVMLDDTGGPISGAKNWTNGYMPAAYQGVVVNSTGDPILDLQPRGDTTRAVQRTILDRLRMANERHLAARKDNTELAARIASYELGYEMQETAPEAFDVMAEDESTRSLYGFDGKKTISFGRKLLIARRLVQRGVRFIQVYSGGNHNDANWDAHGDLEINHNKHAGATDKPIAGLLADLKRTGLLDETLVVWTGEFGRQPTAEYAEGTGRDHNSYGFTLWMAGGGIKGGHSVGRTDDLGSAAVEDRYHVRNLHATVLDQLGLDPNNTTYRFAGLDQKLVGVEGAQPFRVIT
ncbi:MAG: hypothetical protein ACI8QC_003451 [Planctomycetota bacterium]|jgi:hypothetical protein